MENNAASGPDKINAYAIKKLPSTHAILVNAFVDAFENNKTPPRLASKRENNVTTKKTRSRNYKKLSAYSLFGYNI